MEKFLLSPPVVFIVIFGFVMFLYNLFFRFSYKTVKKKKDGGSEPYACGEDIKDHMAQPDYSEFFPFTFFFTVAHVATLIITTVPFETMQIVFMALIYIVVIIIGLFILLWR